MKFHVLTIAGLLTFGAVASPVRVELADGGRSIDLGRLLGGNVALWYQSEELQADDLEANLERWQPSLLRLPGGSWSDEIYWNGHGVRTGDAFDVSKRDGTTWKVDFSGYSPGFRLSKADGTLSDFHGHMDVKALHDYVQRKGAAAIVTVNAGTGNPEMAAEWVRWAKKEGYQVDYWEVGNELDGEWELGHIGPDGKIVDAAEYARRFVAFAKAMKAVDPTIKVGGPTASNDQLPFVEAVIREAGELLDFVTFHTYPVLGSGLSEVERFEKANDVRRAVEKIRSWIRKYQPTREDEIEIGVTEWHKQVMETRPTVDLSSGLWTAMFIGAMAESGVDFANQWDYFSDVGGGGHGLFGRRGEGERASFHAMMLWRERMGSKLVTMDGLPKELTGFATLRDGEPRIMLINATHGSVEVEGIVVGDQPMAGEVKAWQFSQREYFWNPHAQRPEWSQPARSTSVDAAGFVMPPMTVMVISGEAAEKPLVETGFASLEILLPDEAPADLPVEGFVIVRGEGRVSSGALERVELTIEGEGESDKKDVATGTSVGSFKLTTGAPGSTKVMVRGGGLKAEKTITWTQVKERSEVFWEFAGDDTIDGLEQNYGLGVDGQVRPNQMVAVVDLDQAIDEPQKNCLLAIKEMPEDLKKDRIGGISGLIGGSNDLKSEDPHAFVQVVVQSNLDHWMPIGKVPLKELKGEWKALSLSVSDPRVLAAMHELYAVRFHLKSKSPVSGRIYFDDLGFIFRGE